MFEFENQIMKQKLSVRKMVIVAKGGYKNQYIRSFTPQLDFNKKDKILELVDRKLKSGSNAVGASEISMIAPDLLIPSSAPLAESEIPNGWGEKRGIFMMEVVEELPYGNSNVEKITFVQGFTDYWGVSKSGFIDENMKFYINTLITMTRTINSLGQYNAIITGYYTLSYSLNKGLEVKDRTNEFRSQLFGALNQNNSKDLLLARPEDIMLYIPAKNMVDETIKVELANYVNQGNQPIVNIFKKSYQSPTYHVSESISSIIKSNLDIDYTMSAEEIFSRASSLLRNGIDTIPFYRELTSLKGLSLEPSFTLKDLKELDPELPLKSDKVINVIVNDNITLATELRLKVGDESEELYIPTEENRIATIINNTLSYILSSLSLFSVTGLHMTNITGNMEVVAQDVGTFVEGLDKALLITKLINKVQLELMPVITKNNQLLVDILVDSSLLSDTVMMISINHNPPVSYRIPTFADSISNPLITDRNNFENITETYKEISESLMYDL